MVFDCHLEFFISLRPYIKMKNNYLLFKGLCWFFQDEFIEKKPTKYIESDYNFYENMDKELGYDEKETPTT